MRLADFNKLLNDIMDEEEVKVEKKAPVEGKAKFLRESLLRATKDIDRGKLKGAKKIAAYEAAYKEILEGYYPGQAWYNTTTSNMCEDFANGCTPKEVMTNIVEGLKKPTPKKSTKKLTESMKLKEGRLSAKIKAAATKLLGGRGGRGEVDEAVEDDYDWDSTDDDYFDDEYFDDEYSEYDDWDDDLTEDAEEWNHNRHGKGRTYIEDWTDNENTASNSLSRNTEKINNAKTVQELVKIVKDSIPADVQKEKKVAAFLKKLPLDKSIDRARAHVYNFILADKDKVVEKYGGKDISDEETTVGAPKQIWDKSGKKVTGLAKGFPAEKDAEKWNHNRHGKDRTYTEGCTGPNCRKGLKEAAGNTITIHWTDNARAANRGGGYDSINDTTFTYTDIADLVDQIYEEIGISLDPDKIGTLDDIWAYCDEADLGSGEPIIFTATDSRGNVIYDSGLDESDWSTEDFDEDWGDDEALSEENSDFISLEDIDWDRISAETGLEFDCSGQAGNYLYSLMNDDYDNVFEMWTDEWEDKWYSGLSDQLHTPEEVEDWIIRQANQTGDEDLDEGARADKIASAAGKLLGGGNRRRPRQR